MILSIVKCKRLTQSDLQRTNSQIKIFKRWTGQLCTTKWFGFCCRLSSSPSSILSNKLYGIIEIYKMETCTWKECTKVRWRQNCDATKWKSSILILKQKRKQEWKRREIICFAQSLGLDIQTPWIWNRDISMNRTDEVEALYSNRRKQEREKKSIKSAK